MSTALDIPPGGKGGRTAFRATGLSLCDEANDRVLAALTDEDREHWFIAALDAGIRKCDRTCMNLYAEMRGLVNRKLDLAVNVVNLIGAPATFARSAVETVRAVEGMSDLDCAREGLKLALEYCERTGVSLESLQSGSRAEVLEAQEGPCEAAVAPNGVEKANGHVPRNGRP